MTPCEAQTHTLKSSLYPSRQFSKIWWKPRGSQVYERRLGRGEAVDLGEEVS